MGSQTPNRETNVISLWFYIAITRKYTECVIQWRGLVQVGGPFIHSQSAHQHLQPLETIPTCYCSPLTFLERWRQCFDICTCHLAVILGPENENEL